MDKGIMFSYDSNDHITITMPKSIDTGTAAHRFFGLLSYTLEKCNCNNILLDFKKTEFIASNQFAILGCVLIQFLDTHPEGHIHLTAVSEQILSLISKNGFGRHFDFDITPDVYNTVIPYRIFDVDQLKEYESYLTLKIFSRDDLPLMTSPSKSLLQDYLLEVFKNVKDHTTSGSVFTCGQYFPKSKLLYFTIVDAGETIPHNVINYFSSYNQIPPDNILEWALQEGTSTANQKGPRGIGLYLIKNFIKSNHGRLYIVSGNTTYEIQNNSERYKKVNPPFPGTIVTLAFNLGDSSFYMTQNQEIVEIQF